MFDTLIKFFNFCNAENRHKFYGSIIVGIFNSFFMALRIGAMAVLLQGVIRHVQGVVPFTMDIVWLSLGIMVASLIGATVTKRIMSMWQTEGGYRTCASKRIEIAEHLRYLPMGYFNKNSLGYITSVTTNTMEQLGDVATRVVMMVTQGILDTILIIVMIAFFDWRIAIVATVGFALFQFINTLMRMNVRAVSHEKVESDSKVVEKVLEYIQGIAEVKAYNMTGKRSKELNEIIDRNTSANIGMELKCVPLSNLQTFVAKLTGVAIMMFSIHFYLNGSMELANCAVMLVCSFMLFAALELGGSYAALLRAVDISVNRANDILNKPTMDIDGEDIAPANHDIKADGIDFAYDKRKIIDNVTLSIPEKTTTAIVGPSGSGKTTLCHLLSRFWDVNAGSVTLGGRRVQDYSMDSLMKNFSFVFQNVYLFRDTIENNIKFGNPSATHEQVVEAAKKACCHDFIEKLPDGYNTVIGEGGASLSGGERQRISIARAIMKDSPVIILDEATANVDPENERDLMLAIQELTREKTVIMIAHRLKTVRHADQIIVLDKGRIVEQGKHEELVKNGGIYARFIDSRREAVSWKL